MISIYQLKPKFQALLRPIAQYCVQKKYTANQVTSLACLLSIVVAIAVAMGSLAAWSWVWLLMPIWFFVRMALNAIDGMMAREFGQQTTLGAYLNELGDVVADIALYAAFFAFSGVNPIFLLVVLVLMLISEYAGVMGPLVGASRHYEGPMGKSDRAFVFGLLSTLAGFSVLSALWLNIVLFVMCFLLIWTSINRIKAAIAEKNTSSV